MSDIAIRVENLSKKYRIGRQETYKRFSETLMGLLMAPLQRLQQLGRPISAMEILWALRDVSLEIKEGEVLGIIGANGAGKSTLLKILSRITEPTQGQAEVYGRLGSLLEVGTGFHPELTGRENIFLNGSILGMRRHEISRKFDEIVAFAEVEKFIDTPVKRYSSGMYVRLAFGVAAHLEPEILVVDEVLAVGDTAFQKKCLGKMSEVAESGRTVLLVSHNMGAIKSLATRTLWLHKGQLKELGDPRIVVNNYLNAAETEIADGFYDTAQIEARRVHHQKYIGQIQLKSVWVKNEAGQTSGTHLEGADMFVELEFAVLTKIEALELFIRVRTMEGQLVFTGLPGKKYQKLLSGLYKTTLRFNLAPLLPGVYQGDVVLLSNVPQDNVSPAFRFEIAPDPNQPDDYRTTLLPSTASTVEAAHTALGLIRVKATWESLYQVNDL